MSSQSVSSSDSIVHIDGCDIDLKNRYFAAVLACLIPGAGHFYQRRTHKAYMFGVCILGLFFLGLYLGNGRVVYAAWNPDDYRIQFPAQVCVGLPALPAIIQVAQGNTASSMPVRQPAAKGGAAPEKASFSWSEFMAPPANREVLDSWHEQASAGFELGSLFTAVAGLLNLLVIFDAFGGPMPMPTADERRKKQ